MPDYTQARPGTQNGMSKLDEVDVCFIRSMYHVLGLTITEIAARRKLPRTTVRDIVRRNTWQHIPPGVERGLAPSTKRPRAGAEAGLVDQGRGSYRRVPEARVAVPTPGA